MGVLLNTSWAAQFPTRSAGINKIKRAVPTRIKHVLQSCAALCLGRTKPVPVCLVCGGCEVRCTLHELAIESLVQEITDHGRESFQAAVADLFVITTSIE